MVWERLSKELILPQIEARDSADIFEQAGGKLVSLGYCKDSYVEALKIREKDIGSSKWPNGRSSYRNAGAAGKQ